MSSCSSISILQKHFNEKCISGALWDLDGTILDCEILYDMALQNAALSCGLPPLSHEAAESIHGMTLENEILFYLSFAKTESVSFDTLEKLFWIEFGKLDWNQPNLVLPGVEEASLAFYQAGLVQSLATMSSEFEVIAKEPAASEIYKRFKHKVWWGDKSVALPKPAPDVYLEAAKRCGIDPKECIAFEDTIRGTTSAAKAGCAVISIPSVKPYVADDFLKAGALLVVDRLDEIDFVELLQSLQIRQTL